VNKQKLFFLTWLTPVVALSVYLSGLHQIVFENSSGDQLITTSKDYFQSPSETMKAAHFLSKKCGCSKRVARRLEKRGPAAFTEEVIFQVDQDLPNKEQLLQAGFKVFTISSEDLSKVWGIDAVPLLQASNQKVSYHGGYQDYKSGDYQDLQIFEALQSGTELTALPVLGCASSQKLAQRIDPLGLKYTGEQQ
jgi:hypothetical protein